MMMNKEYMPFADIPQGAVKYLEDQFDKEMILVSTPKSSTSFFSKIWRNNK